MSGYNPSKLCALCNQESQTLKMCGRCKNVWYCDTQHQREHWKKHKPVCSVPLTEIGNMTGAPQNESVKKKKGRKNSKGRQNGKVNVPDPNSAAQLFSSLSINNKDSIDNEITSNLQDIAGGGFIKRNSQGNRSRKLSLEPNLSTPIDNGGEIEVSDSLHSTSTSLLHQDVPLASKTTGLVVSTDWITDVADLVVQDLNQFGICVVDDFLGSQQAEKIFDNVSNLYNKGVFRDGEVVSQSIPAQDREKIRGDKITWVSGSESTCLNIGQLVAVLDAIISTASKHANADKIADYNIKTRTRAMVACYPGSDAHYVKHVDNPNNDGRCITAIYYLNKDWQKENGGVLRVYPEDSLHQVAEIEPLFDRMLFFWSDRRNPHEVLPAKMTRYAATVWYLNQDEREAYLSRRRER